MNAGAESGSPEPTKHQSFSAPLSLKEAPLILGRLQQSIRHLSGDLDPDGLRKVLKSMETDTSSLAQVFAANNMSLMSALSTSAGRLVKEFSREEYTLDASALKTLSHALDCLRGYGTEKAIRAQTQRLPIHVMILDDDPLCLKFMAQALSVEPMNVVLCETAEQALSRLKTHYFDVILSDVAMPEVDGFAFIQRLRQIRMHANTPVIFVTGLDDLMTRSKSRLTGGSDFLAKPFRPAELTAKVITCAWRRRISSEPEATEAAPEASPSMRIKSGGELPEQREVQSQIGVVSITSEGRVKSINRQGASMLGYSVEELLNTEVAQFLAELDAAGKANGLTTDWLAEHAQQATSTPVLGLRKTGEHSSMQVRVSRQSTGSTAVYVCLLTAS
jgi:PAS domain S-box-containing protein